MHNSKEIALKLLKKAMADAEKVNEAIAEIVEGRDDVWVDEAAEITEDQIRQWGTFNVRRPANDD